MSVPGLELFYDVLTVRFLNLQSLASKLQRRGLEAARTSEVLSPYDSMMYKHLRTKEIIDYEQINSFSKIIAHTSINEYII